MTSNVTSEDIVSVQESVSKHKLGMFQDEDLSQASHGENLFVNFQMLRTLISPLACPLCFQSTLQLHVYAAQNLGFVCKLVLSVLYFL
ncbi:hypothetical protein PoB_001237600 [Plakobranchus ocellatus]|uniref:Uncharacterized protein n=1 Tax=Plakobranchus ocellatus TaxID=259542 RepID=A0AAV3YU29_9GAST|nr:hypothetical protein PoB_001237600 [Plakobranchus ocellatus]